MDTTDLKEIKQDKIFTEREIAIIKAHFAKKAEEARAFLEAHPIPEQSNRTAVISKHKVNKEADSEAKVKSSIAEKKMDQMRETLSKYPIPFDTIKK